MPFEPYFPPPERWMPKTAALTPDQLRTIAGAIGYWALLECTIQQIMCTLIQSPYELGQALTEDLGPDHRLKAMRRLCRHWEKALRPDDERRATLTKVREFASWIDKNKATRNQLVHWNWARMTDDELFAFKFTFKPKPENPNDGSSYITSTTDEVFAFAKAISEKVSEGFALVDELTKLPPWPERRGGPSQQSSDPPQQDQ